MNILLTGSTGYLGHYLVPLLADKKNKLFLLVRKKSLGRAIATFAPLENPNIFFISGDITSSNIVDSEEDVKVLSEHIDVVIHAAALYDIMSSEKECYLQNILGTQNVLAFLRELPKVTHFHYISTIAVAGNYQGSFYEKDLDLGQKFSNFYAKTKFEAERIVRQFSPSTSSHNSGQNYNRDIKLSRHIYRLGVLVGNSIDGKIDKIDGPYYLFPFFRMLKQKKTILSLLHLKHCPFPMNPDSQFPICPVDEAAKFVANMVFSPQKRGLQTYHVFSPNPPTMLTFIGDCMSEMGLELKPLPIPKNSLNHLIVKGLNIPQELLEYAFSEAIYNQEQLVKDYPELKNKMKSYLQYKDAFFQYVKKMWLPPLTVPNRDRLKMKKKSGDKTGDKK